MSSENKRHSLFLTNTIGIPLINRADESLESRRRKDERPTVDSLALGMQFIDKPSDHTEITSASSDGPEQILVLR